MPRFLYPEAMQEGERVRLSKEESHHFFNVLRLRNDAAIELIDGKGTLATGRVVDATKHATEVVLEKVKRLKAASAIRVCFGLAKSQATDFLIRRCTELGVHSFQPLITDHGLGKKTWNASRWLRVVEEVSKQCQETHFPVLYEPLAFREWYDDLSPRLIIACDENVRTAMPALKLSAAYDLVLGAEGGWSLAERQALAKKALLLGLGKNRLRAETAALVSLTLVKEKVGELVRTS